MGKACGSSPVKRRGPVSKLAVGEAVGVVGVAETLPLPPGIVGVTHRQRLPPRGVPADACGIGRGDVGAQRRKRGAIDRDVVGHDGKDVPVVGDAQQPRTKRDLGGEVERGGGPLRNERVERVRVGRLGLEGRQYLRQREHPLYRSGFGDDRA